MHTCWEYFRVVAPSDPAEGPDLMALGREGWELVAVRETTWIFKRPEPDPIERFTREQSAAALADVAAHQTVTRTLLNPDVAALIRRVNHTDLLLLADRGFPIPALPTVVDLSLTADIPTIPQVLAAILPDLPCDRLIVADELLPAAPDRWRELRAGRRVESIPHSQFKQLAARAQGCIRTGDATPYANTLVVGG